MEVAGCCVVLLCWLAQHRLSGCVTGYVLSCQKGFLCCSALKMCGNCGGAQQCSTCDVLTLACPLLGHGLVCPAVYTSVGCQRTIMGTAITNEAGAQGMWIWALDGKHLLLQLDGFAAAVW